MRQKTIALLLESSRRVLERKRDEEKWTKSGLLMSPWVAQSGLLQWAHTWNQFQDSVDHSVKWHTQALSYLEHFYYFPSSFSGTLMQFQSHVLLINFRRDLPRGRSFSSHFRRRFCKTLLAIGGLPNEANIMSMDWYSRNQILKLDAYSGWLSTRVPG